MHVYSTIVMLLPLRRIWSSLVILLPSGVISLKELFIFTIHLFHRSFHRRRLTANKKYTYNSVTSSKTISEMLGLEFFFAITWNCQFIDLLKKQRLYVSLQLLSLNYWTCYRELFKTAKWKDTDKVIKSQQSPDDFFVGFHDNVNPGADTFIHKLWKEGKLSAKVTKDVKY